MIFYCLIPNLIKLVFKKNNLFYNSYIFSNSLKMYVFIENKLGYKQINFHQLKKCIAFIVTPYENNGNFCHLGVTTNAFK